MPTMKLSQECLEIVWRAMPAQAPGLPPASIAPAVRHYQHATVRHALRILVQQGRARRIGSERAYTYWRLPDQKRSR
jgi:hypothetical protein